MKRTILVPVLLVIFVGTLMGAGTVHAYSPLDRIASWFGFSSSQATSVSYGYGFNYDHYGLTGTYQSGGSTLTVGWCSNGAFYDILQQACSSAANSCGMTGSGFTSSVSGAEAHLYLLGSQNHGCTATTPPESWCPKCTPSNICSADGKNVVNSCTNGIVASCSYGCANGHCNPDPSCTSANICSADGQNVVDTCTNGIVASCPYGCSNGSCNSGTGGPSTTSCTTSNICSASGDVINSCTGTLITSCPYGCTAGTCNLTCTPKNVCRADGNVHDRCSDTLIETCPAGCANGGCKNSCTQPSICGADGDVHDGCSTDALVGTCSFGCSNGACYTTPSAASVTAFAAIPALVQSGATTKVHWITTHATSCTVKGTNGDSWTGVFGDQITTPITGQTIYTLTCTGADDGTISQTATINIVPTYKEQ